MNSPSRVITFVNAAHFIDHYAMLIFAAAVIIMGPALGMAYSELLPYATPGFVAFGAGSLITGWLGDRWSRRHMLVILFAGIGASMIAVGFVQTPLTAQNNFEMPALITPDQAAAAMLDGWSAGDFDIHYPKRFTRWMKLLRLLPYRAYFPAVRRFTGL